MAWVHCPPRLAIATDVGQVTRPESVLVYGSLPADVERELAKIGVSLVVARSMKEALQYLAS